MAQFDQAADELGLDWSSARVIRTWERWRLAVEVFKGEREARSFIGRDFHAAQDRSRKNLEEPIRGVKHWLRSRPTLTTTAAYNQFAKAHNASKASADKRLRSSRAVSVALRLYWPNVIAVARGEISLTAAREQELAELLPKDTSEAILGLPGASRLLKRSETAVRTAFEQHRHFPVPVAVIGSQRAWLYEDVKLYKRGLATPKRSEGELQYLYMDATELRTRLKLSAGALQRRVNEKRWDLVPRPQGAVAVGVQYWLRREVEDWLRVKGKAELTPEQEDEIKKANTRRAAVIGASLRASRKKEPWRYRKRGKRQKRA
ncbi:MAG TPA: hypothetical protein VFW48_07145 [Solirubrobacterales bacterium]|nr:hypothetical protein [Solirubrobacterales bacterium]